MIKNENSRWANVWIEPFSDVVLQLTVSFKKVFDYVLLNTSDENIFSSPHEKTAETTGVSTETVTDALRILLKADFLRKKNSNEYMINPKILYFCDDNKKLIKEFAMIENVYKKNLIHYCIRRKIEINNFSEATKGFSGKGLTVVLFIIKNLDKDNTINMIQKDVVDKLDLSYQTVSRTFVALKKNGFFIKSNLRKKYTCSENIIRFST